jgi:hypothetical protein
MRGEGVRCARKVEKHCSSEHPTEDDHQAWGLSGKLTVIKVAYYKMLHAASDLDGLFKTNITEGEETCTRRGTSILYSSPRRMVRER